MSSIVIAGDTSGSITLQAPAVSGSSVLSLPAVTDTVVGVAATQTLTNKTLTGAVMNGTLGATTPSTGAFTSVRATSLVSTGTSQTAGANQLALVQSGATSILVSYGGGVGSGNRGAYDFYQSDSAAGNVQIPLSISSAGAVSALTTFAAGTTIGVGGATPSASGAGITFPASRSASTDANTLDDFEEGTWTPTCVSSGGTITTVGTVGGTYQIVGSRINAQGFANITTNGTGSGVIILGGLPTNPSSNVVGYGTETSVTYKALAVLKYTTSALNIAFYDHTYPGANGALLSVGYIDTAVF
jgi:hypothetical protein